MSIGGLVSTSSTELSLSNELTRLVAQRERYELAAKAATDPRTKERHARTLQRLEDEIVGLREALTSLTPLPIRERAPVPAPTREPDPEPATLKAAPVGTPQPMIERIESWPIDTPPTAKAEPRSIVEPKPRPSAVPPPLPPTLARRKSDPPAVAAAPHFESGLFSQPSPAAETRRGPTRDSGLFAMPTALPMPDALARAIARPDRWPDRLGSAGELPRVARPARPIATRSSVPPRRAPMPSAAPVAVSVPRPPIDPEVEADADAFDAVLLRRRITHQAAKVMSSAFAIGFVVAAVAFLSGRSSPPTPTPDPVLASSNNTP